MQTRSPAMLSESLNFLRQVELKRTIEGVYPISKLARLSEVLMSNEGMVSAKLEFCHSVGYACLKGKVSATLLVQCQRCLKPVETKISGRFKFGLVNSEEDFELLPEEFEPYLVEGEEQSVIDLIEDELLLSLPMVTVHENSCSDFMSEQERIVKAEKEAAHPFAALEALKNDSNNKVN